MEGTRGTSLYGVGTSEPVGSPGGVVAEVGAGPGREEIAPPRYLHWEWDGAGAVDGHVHFYARGPCSLVALEGKPFEFSKPQLVVKVTPLTGVSSGLSPSVAILCFPRGF